MSSAIYKNAVDFYSRGTWFVQKLLTLVVWVTPILVLYDNTNFNILPGFVRQAWFALLFAMAILSKPSVRVIPLLIVSIAFVSILCNDIPAFMKPYPRLIYFAIMMGAIGPLFSSKWTIAFQKRLWKATLFCFAGATILSFATYLLKIGKCFDRHGNLLGIMNHSMNLGPVSGISCIFCFWIFLKKLCTEKKISLPAIALSIICLLTCLLSGSRAATTSCLAGLLFLTVISSPIFRRLNFWLLFLPLIIFATATSLYFLRNHGYFDRIAKKNQFSEKKGQTLLYTRKLLWQSRLREFTNRPLTGVGFASVDLENQKKIDTSTGNIEPGNSWLFAFSSIGIIGGALVLAAYFLPFIKILPTAIKGNNNQTLIASVMLFYSIHMLAEGYLLSAGNLSFFLVWTTITIAWNLTRIDPYNNPNDNNIPPIKNPMNT